MKGKEPEDTIILMEIQIIPGSCVCVVITGLLCMWWLHRQALNTIKL